MPNTNIVALLKECVVLYRKTRWLARIDRKLVRYINASQRNKRLFYKIDSMICRYNHIFGENLGYDDSKETCKHFPNGDCK